MSGALKRIASGDDLSSLVPEVLEDEPTTAAVRDFLDSSAVKSLQFKREEDSGGVSERISTTNEKGTLLGAKEVRHTPGHTYVREVYVLDRSIDWSLCWFIAKTALAVLVVHVAIVALQQLSHRQSS